MTIQKRTRHGLVTGDQADHKRLYVATRRLRWGDRWLEVGEEVPQELGRNYGALVRRGDIAPYVPLAEKSDRS